MACCIERLCCFDQLIVSKFLEGSIEPNTSQKKYIPLPKILNPILVSEQDKYRRSGNFRAI